MGAEVSVASESRTYPRSNELYDRTRPFTTEGVHHAGRYRQPHPIYMERGEGSRIQDVDGNWYIDFSLGSGPLVLGHNHPRVVQAINDQLAKAQLYGTACRAEAELAGRIHQGLPSAETVRFVTTGTEAVALAARLARAYTSRSLVVKHEGAFHGAHEMFLTGLPAAKAVNGRFLGVDQAVSDQTVAIPYNDVKAFEDLVEARGDEIAALVVEPALRGVVAPDAGYLERLRALCDASGIVLIYDEVVTGFRLGPGGAESQFGVSADLTALGKVIGGGVPIGAVCGHADLLEFLSPTADRARSVFAASTWYGYPVAMAAGCAALDVLEDEGGYAQLDYIGSYFRSTFSQIFSRTRLPGQVLGFGPVNKVMMTGRKVSDYSTAMPEYPAETLRRIHRRLFEQGVFMQGPSYLPGFGKYLSTRHSTDDIDRAAEAFEGALSESAG